MSIHPNGDGSGWTNVETVDVNQPHGKDYLYSQHIAIGVRKRMNQEHSTFADGTVGGIHKPGGAAVLGECDGTPGAADGTYRGHGIVWDLSSRLWCSTALAGASTSGDFTVITLHPDKQWKGGDVTWAGEHDFNAPVCFSAVDISNSLDVTGVLACGSTATIMKLLTCNSNAVFAGDVSISGDADVTTPTTDPQIANKKYVDDQITARAPAAAQVKAWCRVSAAGTLQGTGYNIASTSRSAEGNYVITWDTDFADVNYAVNITIFPTDSPKSFVPTILTMATGSVTLELLNFGGTAYDGDFVIAAFGTQ